MNKKAMVLLSLFIAVFVSGVAYMKDVKLYNPQKQIKTIEGSKKTVEEEAGSMQDDRKAIEGVYHAMYQYELAKDVEHLSNLLSDDYVLIHMTGLQQPKEEYLRCVREGQLNYFSEETDQIAIEFHGDTAMLTGRSRVNAAVFGGSRHTWPLQLVISMKKMNGRWMMTKAQASTY